MAAQHTAGWTRWAFLGGMGLAGTAGLSGLSSKLGARAGPHRPRLSISAT
jgi:hypothetical protein